jgi:hypothetical protein
MTRVYSHTFDLPRREPNSAQPPAGSITIRLECDFAKLRGADRDLVREIATAIACYDAEALVDFLAGAEDVQT